MPIDHALTLPVQYTMTCGHDYRSHLACSGPEVMTLGHANTCCPKLDLPHMFCCFLVDHVVQLRFPLPVLVTCLHGAQRLWFEDHFLPDYAYP